MNRDVQSLKESCEALTVGWTERIEYRVVDVIGGTELRHRTQHHGSLIGQLQIATRTQTAGSGEPSYDPNKSESQVPMNMAPLNLIELITQESASQFVTLHENLYGPAPVGVKRKLIDVLNVNVRMASALALEEPRQAKNMASVYRGWVSSARVILGYDARMMTMTHTRCGSCDSALIAPEDASDDVRCSRNECDTVYRREQWIHLL